MPIETAADRAVFTNPGDFGVEILWAGAADPIPALLQNGTLRISTMDGPDIQTREATLIVAEADLPFGHDQDDEVTIGAKVYVARSIEPDGVGMALIRLELADG